MYNRNKTNFKAGMYLLETLTAGMYNEPLAIYREYIQNSVDSIDLLADSNKDKIKVKIHLDPFEKRIIISDNGGGLPVNIAEEVLCTLGSSNKRNRNLRGFRGIGRLGGIAFSDKATFRTKAHGETIESIQEWDCKKFRKYLSDAKKSKMSLVQLIKNISKFTKTNSKKPEGSYFSVTLDGVTSFRNYIFDLQKVIKYLSQIAPVNFNPKTFSYGNEINDWLSNNLENYGTYNIILNDTPVYKPYQDLIKTNKKGSDKIIGIEKFKIEIKGQTVAYGWYGIRDKLLGGITRGEDAFGIRVRAGNILIGDSHLLDGCFREARFNSYIVGEIHVNSAELIPNSRRDDFIDNEFKTLFYNEIEKTVGLPLSKEIRKKSRIQPQRNKTSQDVSPLNKTSINEVNKKILNHANVDKLLEDILSVFSSNKAFNEILLKYDILSNHENEPT